MSSNQPSFSLKKIKVVLTDIEGTTSSISFVKDVLFPYARKSLREFVARNARKAEVREQLVAAAKEANLPTNAGDDAICLLLESWIDQDCKATPLKALQGMIWETGYADGDFKAHVYADVAPALHTWKESGLRLAVYSSGSILAQKLFFAHSEAGNLLPLFENYFDTTSGGKREAESYKNIANALCVLPEQVLFLSDIPEELHAATEAGMATVQLLRPEVTATLDKLQAHAANFSQITFEA